MVIYKKELSPTYIVSYVLVFMLLVGTGFAPITFLKTYGGPDYDYACSVHQNTDGGYIVTGYTHSFGDTIQVYLIKTDSLGDTLWTRTYGGLRKDKGACVKQTIDGGYIVVGYTNSFGDSNQIYIIKTNPAGETLWTKTYGGPGNEYGTSVWQTTDGGYIISGAGVSGWGLDPVYLLKTDSLGNLQWWKTYLDTIGACAGRSVQQTRDGGYIIGGGCNDQFLLIKTDSLGEAQWIRLYGGSGGFKDGYSVQQTTDGGYILAGYANVFIHLLKTDSLGDTLWTKTFGTSYGNPWYTYAFSVQQTFDGGYILTGCQSDEGIEHAILIKTDSLGDTLWTRLYSLYGLQSHSIGFSVQQTSDSGYIITGSGNYPNSPSGEAFLIKTDAEGNVAGLEENRTGYTLPYQTPPLVFPNPFAFFTTVIGYEREQFILYDVSGRQVGKYFGDRIGFGLPPGVYFIIPEDKSFKPVRVVKVK